MKPAPSGGPELTGGLPVYLLFPKLSHLHRPVRLKDVDASVHQHAPGFVRAFSQSPVIIQAAVERMLFQTA